ncbi:hypothetical protein [Nonomuraea dietziae]|uniref:hypothetical protein n=1 Tax=Nonomuraea dietziae TaxID=65515 RepID=UPI003403BE61
MPPVEQAELVALRVGQHDEALVAADQNAAIFRLSCTSSVHCANRLVALYLFHPSSSPFEPAASRRRSRPFRVCGVTSLSIPACRAIRTTGSYACPRVIGSPDSMRAEG